MQYLIHDLLQLPLEDRLAVVEKIICSSVPADYEAEIKALLGEMFSRTAPMSLDALPMS